jgi:hypothetical protein
MSERAKAFWGRTGKAIAGVSISVASLVGLYGLAAAQYAEYAARAIGR